MNLLFANDSVFWVSRRYIREEQVPSLRHTNEVVAAYVACAGRIHSYAYLHKLGQRDLYCDTGSIISFQKADEMPVVQFRDALGNMTSELKVYE